MKILLLGGTRFIGRAIVEAALQGGHEVSLFNRGRTNKDLFPEIERLQGDRHHDLRALAGRKWDAVIDTSGYLPSAVQATAEALKDSVQTYLFISSGSVYRNLDASNIPEDALLKEIGEQDLAKAETIRSEEAPTAFAFGQHYGALKAICETTVAETLPQRAAIIRPGLVVGPHDYTNRIAYWLQRIENGGECLAPKHPDSPVKFIDVRDLAAWTIRAAEDNLTGVFNASGREGETLGQFLDACRAVTQSDANFTWVDESFLLERDIKPWNDIPLWLPDAFRGMFSMSDAKATAAGLTYRPLEDTIADTLAWLHGDPEFKIETGIGTTEEAELLQAWRNS